MYKFNSLQKQIKKLFLAYRSLVEKYMSGYFRLANSLLCVFVIVVCLNTAEASETPLKAVAASGITNHSAYLNFTIDPSAAEKQNVTLFWSTENEGKAEGAWEYKVEFADVEPGAYGYKIDNLNSDSNYVFNVAIAGSDSATKVWGNSSSFRTLLESEWVESIWFDDTLPDSNHSEDLGGTFNWNETVSPRPYSGSNALQLSGTGTVEKSFAEAKQEQQLTFGEDDTFYAFAYVDAANQPKQIMIQLVSEGKKYRAYWGDQVTDIQIEGVASFLEMGPLPPSSQWMRLQVPVGAIGLQGKTVDGMSFVVSDGKVTFDRVGKIGSDQVPGETFQSNQSVSPLKEDFVPSVSMGIKSRPASPYTLNPDEIASISKRSNSQSISKKSSNSLIRIGGEGLDVIKMEVSEPFGYEAFGSIPASTGVDAQGNFNYSLPLDLPVGINGMTPSITLSYNSGNSNEAILGRGWSLNYNRAKIERRRLNLIDDGEYTIDKYDDESGFQLNGEPLRQVSLDEHAFYVTDQDMHARIRRRTDSGSSSTDQYTVDYWTVEHKNGIKQTLDFRTIGETKQMPSLKAEAWIISKEEDFDGNQITYEHDSDLSIIKEIKYAYVGENPNVKVVFNYSNKYSRSRPSRIAYKDGERYQIDKKQLEAIRIYVGNTMHRSYEIDYDKSLSENVKLVKGIRIYSGNRGNGEADLLDKHSFTYKDYEEGFDYGTAAESFKNSIFEPINGVSKEYNRNTGKYVYMEEGEIDAGVRLFDYNNDGLMDIIVARDESRKDELKDTTPSDGSSYYSYAKLYKNTGSGYLNVTSDEGHCIPPIPFTQIQYLGQRDRWKTAESSKTHSMLIDMNGDGLEDLLRWNGEVYLNNSYDPDSNDSLWQKNDDYKLDFISANQIDHLFNGHYLFVDFNGDGLVDVYKEYFYDNATYGSKYYYLTVSLHYNNGLPDSGNVWSENYSYAHSDEYHLHRPNENPFPGKYADYKDNSHVMPGPLLWTYFKTPSNTLIDLNGDGLADFINYNEDSTDNEIYLNNGRQFVPWKHPVTGNSICIPSDVSLNLKKGGEGLSRKFPQAQFIDLNDDGLTDVIYADKAMPEGSSKVYLNTGLGFAESSDYDPELYLYDSDKEFDLGARFLDFNADGFVDIIQSFEEVIGKFISPDEPFGESSIFINQVNKFSTSGTNTDYLDNNIGLIAYDKKKSYLEELRQYLVQITLDLALTYVFFAPEYALVDIGSLIPDFLVDSSLKSFDSVGQSFFDINGDGTKDMVFVEGVSRPAAGQLDLFGIELNEIKIGLNKRSGDFLKMSSFSNNLESINVSYSPLTKREMLISSEVQPVPSNISAAISNRLIPLHAVESVSQDLGGNDHVVEYFYGDFAIMPGEGFAFGKSIVIDERMETVNISHRAVLSANAPLFGQTISTTNFMFGPSLEPHDLNNHSGREHLLSLVNSAIDYDLPRIEETTYFHEYHYSYSEQFDADHRKVNNSEHILQRARPYDPYFITTGYRSNLYDPDGELKSRQTFVIEKPTRFGAVHESYSSILYDGIITDISDSGNNSIETDSSGLHYRYTTSYESTTSSDWIVDRKTSEMNQVSGRLITDSLRVMNIYKYDDDKPHRLESILRASDRVAKKTDFTYDNFGNVTGATNYYEGDSDDKKRSVSTEYVSSGPLQGRAISSVTHTDMITTYANHDEYSGRPGSVTDPNGLGTTFEYDIYDRIQKTTAPDGRMTLVTVEKDEKTDDNASYIVRNATSGPHYLYTAHDNIGRPLKSWSPGFDWDGGSDEANQNWNQVFTTYYPNGLIKSVTRPVAYQQGINPSSAPLERKYVYDDFRRLSKVLRDDKLIATYEYPAKNEVTITDTTNSSSLGATVNSTTRILDYGPQASATVNAKGSVVYEFTKLTPTGHVSVIRTDANGDGTLEIDTTIRKEYDLFGRPTILEDPSFGSQSFEYNAFDELTKVIKNEGTDDETIVTYERDPYGRVVEARYTGTRGQLEERSDIVLIDNIEPKEQASRVEKYRFDQGKRPNDPSHKGFLFEKTLTVGGKETFKETYTPDDHGRVVETQTTINEYIEGENDSRNRRRRRNTQTKISHTLTEFREYDALSRLSKLTYPHTSDQTPFSVNYGYRENGMLWQIYDEDDNNKLIWAATDIDEENFIRFEQLGAAVRFDHRKDHHGRKDKTTVENVTSAGTNYEIMTGRYYYNSDDTMYERRIRFNFEGDSTRDYSERYFYDVNKQLHHTVRDSASSSLTNYFFTYDKHSRMLRRDFPEGDGIKATIKFELPDIE